MFKILATTLLAGSLVSHARADAGSDSHQTLMTVARWGVCLLDTMGEVQAKSMVYATVAKVDLAFQRKYGQKATDLAQTAYGEDFAKVYYNLAKIDHDRNVGNREATCRNLNQKVVSLVQ
jgi:hypothetical protein